LLLDYGLWLLPDVFTLGIFFVQILMGQKTDFEFCLVNV